MPRLLRMNQHLGLRTAAAAAISIAEGFCCALGKLGIASAAFPNRQEHADLARAEVIVSDELLTVTLKLRPVSLVVYQST